MTKGQNLGTWVVMSPVIFVTGLSAIGTWPRVGAALMGGAAVYALYGGAVHWYAGMARLRRWLRTVLGIHVI